MRKVVPFRRKKEDDSLEGFLKRAHIIKNQLEEDKTKIIKTLVAQKYFEAVLMRELIDQKLISRELFLCAVYISHMMEMHILEKPENWYAHEYYLSEKECQNENDLKKGADFCFSLCSFFAQRAERRMMKKNDYVSFGRGMYLDYYQKTGKEVASCMSESFEEMSSLAAKCFSI